MARLAAFLLLLLLAWPHPSFSAEGAAAALPSVVSLMPLWSSRPPNPEEPEGTAVAIERDGEGTLLLTADHVIGDADAFRIRTLEGNAYPARLVGRDRDSDLALLKVDTILPLIERGAAPVLGQKVCAVGNAFGLGLSLTCGVVSATERAGVGFNRIEDFVQSDAAVNPGMSGGALVGQEGRLIGLLSAIFTKDSDADIGVNFAVSTTVIIAALRDLRAGGPVAWPHVDLRFGPLPIETTGPLGPRVAHFPKGAAAAEAGFLLNDRILRIGDSRIRNSGEWRRAIALSAPGSSVPIEVWRHDTTQSLTLTIPDQ